MEKHLILIADDDDNDIALLERTLKAAKVSNPVRIVSTGEEAIRYLCGEGKYGNRAENPFPILLVLNLQMPRKTGTEVLAWLQTQETLPPLRIIVLTGHLDSRPILQAIHLGAQKFLRKPPQPEEFMRTLREMPDFRLVPCRDGIRIELAVLMLAAFIN